LGLNRRMGLGGTREAVQAAEAGVTGPSPAVAMRQYKYGVQCWPTLQRLARPDQIGRRYVRTPCPKCIDLLLASARACRALHLLRARSTRCSARHARRQHFT
jgi:hypothetical protein